MCIRDSPEPIDPHIDPLRQAVRAGKYDAGFCADGDGDRIGAIDRDGSFIDPHRIFALLVWHLVGTRNLPGDIAKTFSVTKLIDKLAAKFGRTLREVPIGFKYICELMLEQNILIGGEESGGIGTSLYLPCLLYTSLTPPPSSASTKVCAVSTASSPEPKPRPDS